MKVHPAWLLAAVVVGAPEVTAQESWTAWTSAWSALRPIGLDARGLPFGTAIAERGFGLGPRTGLVWSGGNPAGLARDIAESRAWLEFARNERGGDYRRPLDPDGVGAWTLAGLGWRPLGRGAVAGRFVFDSRHADVATGSDALYPYGADPFVLVDTTSPGRGSTHADLEGAAGWRFGGWHAGLSLGAVLHRDRARDTRFSRIGRSSVTGAMAGLGRAVEPLGLVFAVHGRWLGRRETHLLSTRPGGSQAFILFGFDDPDPIDVSPPGGMLRRTNADGYAGGAAVTGRVGSLDWTASFERGDWSAGHTNTVSVEDPPTDRWEATATRVGVAARVSLPRRLALHLEAGHTALDGNARRADLDGVVFRVSDAVLVLGGSVELADPASPWLAALTVRSERVRLHRQDFLADVPSDITAWLAEGSLAVGRHLGSVSAGVVLGAGLYTPAAAIPDPETLGPVYGTYIAPEKSLYAVAALPLSAALWLRHRFSGSVTAYLRAAGARTSARGPLPPIPALPAGTYHRVHIAVGIELTPLD